MAFAGDLDGVCKVLNTLPRGDPRVVNGFALARAVSGGHVDVIRRLIKAGADVHARHESALFRAAYYGERKLVAILIEAGAKWTSMDPFMLSLLVPHAVKRRDPWLPDLLRASIPRGTP